MYITTKHKIPDDVYSRIYSCYSRKAKRKRNLNGKRYQKIITGSCRKLLLKLNYCIGYFAMHVKARSKVDFVLSNDELHGINVKARKYFLGKAHVKSV